MNAFIPKLVKNRSVYIEMKMSWARVPLKPLTQVCEKSGNCNIIPRPGKLIF